MAYEKHTWECGETVTAELLNHLEDGVENAGSGGGGSSLKYVKDDITDKGGVVENLVPGAVYHDEYIDVVVPEDKANKATGRFSHAEGGGISYFAEDDQLDYYNNVASGYSSHAEGWSTTASGDYSHAEGSYTIASGEKSHTEGTNSTASGYSSHAEGNSSTASGDYSHAEGVSSTASGYSSHAEGCYTIAKHKSQRVFGEYNIEDPSSASGSNFGNYIEIVGNGTYSNRSNARTLDWSGNESLQGSLTLGKGTADETTVTATQLKALLALLN